MADSLWTRIKGWLGAAPEAPQVNPMKTDPGSEMLPAAPPELDDEDDYRDEGNFRKRNDATPAGVLRR
jgi:hypothetical protein